MGTASRSLLAAEVGVVEAVEETVVLSTYPVGAADPHPMFYRHESYQGAQKRIYPYALQDHLIHEPKEQEYKSLRLENEFVRITVLPELGGRLFSATDKTNGYEFFYRQHVVKPALIGMLGAWVSGGVEWCAFHHHRNTTFMPIDYHLQANRDGSKTIWFGETERRHRMKWLIGLTLYPDRSYVEATVKFVNRTAQPHSILYWANVAVHVNDEYQVVFPPSVQVATYHSKIDFTHWPIAQGNYRGYDYQGKDISWWKNSPPSNSFFAWNLQEDFMGGYDHGRQAGVVHVGNHHVVCGAKLWEWGTGAYGRAWDKILTDEDGPYAELMVGAFSDNQPDYSWMKPYEVKTFKQYWYPIQQIGAFQNANLHGAVSLAAPSDGRVRFGFHTTARHRQARVELRKDDRVVWDRTIDVGPDQPFVQELELPNAPSETLRVTLRTAEGEELITYAPRRQPPVDKLPDPVQTPPKPKDVATNEELYLTGLRVEQIHNPTVDALPYYEEALRRDPGDSRVRTMLAIHCNKHAQYELAEAHVCAAIERLSHGYTRLRDAEAHYQLGIALRAQHRDDEAYREFYRATWDQDCHSASCLQLAELDCQAAEFVQALEHVQESRTTNSRNPKAINTQAAILRKLNRLQEAAQLVEAAIAFDPLDGWALNERRLIESLQGNTAKAQQAEDRLAELTRGDVQAFLELAADYMQLGMWPEAIEVLQLPAKVGMSAAVRYPMLHYYLAYLYQQQGNQEAAIEAFNEASRLPSDYCFPFRFEGIDVLQAALTCNPRDARAHYYLGNLLFEHQPERAMENWRKSRELDPTLAMVHRNLGWAQQRVRNDLPAAVACYEAALQCDQVEPRLLLELDLLYESSNADPERRLAALQANHDVVLRRQESLVREILVLVLAGEYETAIQYLESHFFHAQEGREELHDIFVDAHLLEGLQCMKRGDPAGALTHFEKASEYPENLSVGRPVKDPRAAQVAYYTAVAHDALEHAEVARGFFQQSVDSGKTVRTSSAQFYQALSLQRLGRSSEAQKILARLVETGQRRLEEDGSADFFAKFGEQETRRTSAANAHYLLGLGFLGQEKPREAEEQFRQAVKQNRSHVWAQYELSALESLPPAKDEL